MSEGKDDFVFEPGDGELVRIGMKHMHDTDPEGFWRMMRSFIPARKFGKEGVKIGDTFAVRKPRRFTA
jgi:hypothetical protein